MSALLIDLDAEAIQYDGHWLTRDELARKIRTMLDSGDFAVGRPSQALEQLTTTLASLRTMAFRASPDMADALNAAAARSGRSVGTLVREAIAGYLGLPMPTESERSLAAEKPAGPPLTAPPLPRAAGSTGRKQTEPELPAVAIASPLLPTPPDLKATQQVPLPPQLIPGPGALKAAHPPVVPGPSVIVTEDVSSEEAADAVNLTPKKTAEEEAAVERRWFGG